MNENSIKIAITRNFLNSTMENEDIIASEVIIYKYISELVKINNERQNSIDNLISAYSDQLSEEYVNTKNKYSCYSQIREYILNINKDNFLLLTEAELEHIYDLYKNRVLIENFSISSYSPRMYGVSVNISEKDNQKLNKTHNEIFVELSKFLTSKYGIPTKNMHIQNSQLSEDNIGKKITFTVDGISPIIVYTELLNSYINSIVDNIDLDYPNIVITTRY